VKVAAIFLAALLSGCAAPPAAAAIGWITLGAAATAATAAATGTVLNVQMIKKNEDSGK